jgi:DNA-binding transcriptional ArsR family regulator
MVESMAVWPNAQMTPTARPLRTQRTASRQLKPEDLERAAARFKALGHPTRLLFVHALQNGPRCVCELERLVDADISTVSRHLTALRNAGLVQSRREGSKVIYSLCPGAFEQCSKLLGGIQAVQPKEHA